MKPLWRFDIVDEETGNTVIKKIVPDGYIEYRIIGRLRKPFIDSEKITHEFTKIKDTEIVAIDFLSPEYVLIFICAHQSIKMIKTLNKKKWITSYSLTNGIITNKAI